MPDLADLCIRSATADDLDTVVDYNHRLAAESEDKHLDLGTLRLGVKKALARPEYCLYFLAELAGTPVGQVMVTYEWSDWRDGVLWWLQSVYVVPEQRRRGVFRALFSHVETLAEQHPEVVGLRLYVEQQNHLARATYERMGFRPGGYLVYEKI